MAPRRIAAVGLSVIAAACGGQRDRRAESEAALLERRISGLENLLARAPTRGSLLAPSELTLRVDGELVGQLVSAGLPYTRTAGRDGRFTVAVEAADVSFEEGLALVTLSGRARFSSAPEAAQVALSVSGVIDVVRWDRGGGTLVAEVRVIAFEPRRVEVLGVGAPVERLLAALWDEEIAAFETLVSEIEIPIRLASAVELPALAGIGGIHVAAATVGLDVDVADVVSYGGGLWVAVRARLSDAPVSEVAP